MAGGPTQWPCPGRGAARRWPSSELCWRGRAGWASHASPRPQAQRQRARWGCCGLAQATPHRSPGRFPPCPDTPSGRPVPVCPGQVGPGAQKDCQVLREESPDGGLGPSQNVPLHWGGSWCQAAHMPGRGPRTAPKRARKPWLTLCTREPCVLDGGAAAPTRYSSTCLSLGARTEAQLLDRSGGPQGWPWSAAEGAPEQMGSCSQPPNPTEQGGLEVGHGGLQENRGSGSGTVAPSWVRCWV